MAKENAPPLEELYTPERRAIIEELIQVKHRRGWTDHSLARRLGASATTLNRLLHCTYRASSVPDWVEAMAKLLVRERRRADETTAVEYAQTQVADQVHDTVRLAQIEQTIALILGASGCGKTTALRRYAADNPECVYVVAGIDATPRAFLAQIAGQLGLATEGSAYSARLAITEALTDTDRVLIIDECDYLTEAVLQALRMVQENAGIGLVLVGTQAYLAKLRGKSSATIAQVLQRISYVVNIVEAPQADLRLIADAYGCDREAGRVLLQRSGGSARRCVQAIRASRRFNGATLSAAGIAEAFNHLMPLE
ncbi:MAG: AAA family ATPase [Lentisphaerae bacterium]|nr:AAA family ATPase [Lentisphaerota bacterium]